MHPFTYLAVSTEEDAIAAAQNGGRLLAGGTMLVDLMREEVERPDTLVDIAGLALREIATTPDGGVRLGALATLTDAATHPLVRARLPVVVQALEQSASAQVRNVATIGGNLLQRTRCGYFRDVTAACNKREPGVGCAAREGVHRNHAVFGGSPSCIATHPSDLAVALIALDAAVHLHGPDGRRSLAVRDLLLPPGTTPEREHTLVRGELVTAVEVPATPPHLRSGYLKVRDRASFEFAVTSAAVALAVQDGTISYAGIAAGGVGTVPWRLPEVEKVLVGRVPSAELWREAAELAGRGATPLRHNAFKVDLLQRTVERALRDVGSRD